METRDLFLPEREGRSAALQVNEKTLFLHSSEQLPVLTVFT